ncbi:MAG: hypothetical protein ABNH00_10650 [Dokdonia sp.]|jgi:hypothetical protein|nr:hypothetical protein [Cytophagaceae bacterium]
MNTTLKLFAFAFLFGGAISAQNIVQESKETTVVTHEVNDNKSITFKTIDHTMTPVKLKESDKGQVNQARVTGDTKVRKTIMIDSNSDKVYDKKIELSYKMDEEVNLNYSLTDNGLILSTPYNTSKLVTDEGTYYIDSKNVKGIKVTVTNMSTR